MKKPIHILCILSIAALSVYAQPNFSMVGFATQNGGTTGGQAGQTVTARSYSELKSYAESSAAYVIMVEGTITNGTAGGQIRIKSNKSLIGVGSTAFLSGVGLDISNQNNVIVRNLKITLIGTSTPSSVNGGDCISISGTSKNIWIDHNEIYSEDPSVQTNKDKYDGLLDIKGQTGFITLSWNYLHDHHKGGLVGSSDDDLYADRKVTIHHNHYKKVLLRVPMYRGSTGHFFNNYISGATDATEIRAGTCVRVERNYYEALHYSIYTPTDAPGSTERIANVEVSRTSRAYPANCVANIPYNYSAVLISTTNDVKTIVPQYAGVGKIGANTSSSSTILSSSSIAISSSSVAPVTAQCGTNPCISVLQGESFCNANGVIENKNAGFMGTGYVNPDNVTGSSVGYAIQVNTAGNYTLYLRYANGTNTSRDAKIVLNNQTLVENLALPTTGSWTTWATAQLNLNLPAGWGSLVFQSLTADGLPNLDWLGWISSSISIANCEAPTPLLNSAKKIHWITPDARMYDLNGRIYR